MNTPSYRFDAFISYRRTERDTEIALALLHELETFEPPVREAAPRRSRARVFLDQAELSVAPSVEAALKSELRDARFLIVVCSPEAEESPWVRGEVGYYCNLGRRAQILPVLVDGDLDLVKRIVPGDETPLCLDIRAPTQRRKLRRLREERLRLLAPIFDCRYDDLERRDHHRQVQRLRRLALVLSAILVTFVALGVLAYSQAVQANEARVRENDALRREREETTAKLAAQEAELRRREELDEMTELLSYGLTLLRPRSPSDPPSEIMAAYRRWEFLEPLMDAYTKGTFRPQMPRGRIALMRHLTDWAERDLKYGRLDDAANTAKRATDDCESLLTDFGGNRTLGDDIRIGCMLAYQMTARIQCEAGSMRDAASALARANSVGYETVNALGKTSLALGSAKVELALGNDRAAEEGWAAARRTLSSITPDDAELDAGRIYYLALALELEANIEESRGLHQGAARGYELTLKMYGNADDDPGILAGRIRLRRSLARALVASGNPDSSLTLVTAAVDDATRLLDLDSTNLRWRHAFARTQVARATLSGDNTLLEEARTRYDRVLRADPKRQSWAVLVRNAELPGPDALGTVTSNAATVASIGNECAL